MPDQDDLPVPRSVNVDQFPQYLCHKEVRAVKIRSVLRQNGKYVITPEEPAIAPFEVSNEFMDRHGPRAGGYFVVYKDGYTSYSPALAFEQGYAAVKS